MMRQGNIPLEGRPQVREIGGFQESGMNRSDFSLSP
jgi:hypothetical protein